MASVGKDPRDGRWLARWRDPAGRQHKKSFRRKIDAQRWMDQMQAEMHRGQYIDPAGAKLRVGTYADSWAAGLGHLKPSTRARYRGIVGKHVVPTWGTWPLGSVAHSDVATWLAELSESGLRPGTVRQVHRVLSLILDAAVQDGRIGRNPAAGVRLPRQVRSEPRFLSPEEVARLATAASLAIASGANVKAVQRMLGHASAAMTLDIYAGLFADDLDGVADALDDLVPQTCHIKAAVGIS